MKKTTSNRQFQTGTNSLGFILEWCKIVVIGNLLVADIPPQLTCSCLDFVVLNKIETFYTTQMTIISIQNAATVVYKLERERERKSRIGATLCRGLIERRGIIPQYERSISGHGF